MVSIKYSATFGPNFCALKNFTVDVLYKILVPISFQNFKVKDSDQIKFSALKKKRGRDKILKFLREKFSVLKLGNYTVLKMLLK